MAGTGKKWLMGCGIGCGLFIVVIGGVGTCGFFAVKEVAERGESVEAGFETLVDLYGRPSGYRPPVDGAVGDGRLDTFLSVRDDLTASRDALGRTLTDLEEAGMIAKVKAGFTFIPRMMDFVDERNRTLADRGMGLGEYLYIYSTVYYAWLDRDPADGPGFQIGDDGDGDEDDTRVRWSGDWEEDEDVRDRRRQNVRRYLHRIQRAMLRNQLADAEQAGADEAWLDDLRAEADRMDGRVDRMLWSDGLPPAMRGGYEPWRDRLEASYSPVMNAVEVALVRHQ